MYFFFFYRIRRRKNILILVVEEKVVCPMVLLAMIEGFDLHLPLILCREYLESTILLAMFLLEPNQILRN